MPFHRIIASYPVRALTGHQISSMVWAVVRALELSGLHVRAICFDGASSNHNFIKVLSSVSVSSFLALVLDAKT